MKKNMSLIILLLLQIVISQTVFSQGLPTASPEEVGLSSRRLERIKPFMQNYVDQGKLSGLITLVARHGKVVHFHKYGMMDIDKEMEYNTIFRIASMTKPITSVAVMMLYEEGYFQLNDPISKYIPEFKDVKVFSSIDKGKIVADNLIKPITIRDLLTHTSGLTYGVFGDTPVDSIYRNSNLFSGTLKDMITKLSSIPLLYQPGTKWNYSVSTDVLGYFVEVVSGKSLDTFFKEKIFNPLGMKDTDFCVPKDKVDRLAALYGLSENGNLKVVTEPKTSGKPPKFLSGGGGLYSTISDYTRFAQMLLNKGELEGISILGRKTVEFMTRNHLSEELIPIHPVLPGKGFGLGFAVLIDATQSYLIGSEGEYEWRGINNTFFWIDSKEELIMILMTQFRPYLHYQINKEFKILTYQAIVK